MPVVITAKVSTDANNRLSFGSDGGLYQVSAYTGGGGQSPLWMIDNSWGAAGQTLAYTTTNMQYSTVSMAPGTAWAIPFGVTRNCVIAGAQMNVTSVGAGSTIYQSLYSADANTGLPSAKLADLFSFSGATVATAGATLRSNYALTARTLYWQYVWAVTAAPTVSARYGGGTAPIRSTAVPTTPASMFTSTIGSHYIDTSVAWGAQTTAPASTPTPTTTVSTATAFQAAPMTYWLLTSA